MKPAKQAAIPTDTKIGEGQVCRQYEYRCQ